MEKINIGHIVNTFGLKGELKVESYTDFPKKRFEKGQKLLIEQNGKFIEVICKNMRIHKDYLLVQFEGLEDINLVEKYKDCDIYISKEYIHQLNSGEYYFFELKGCSVYQNEEKIGEVIGVEEGYQTVIRIKIGQKETLVPFVPAFIKKVNVEEKRIDVELIEGFI